jgi:hypothetical protein
LRPSFYPKGGGGAVGVELRELLWCEPLWCELPELEPPELPELEPPELPELEPPELPELEPPEGPTGPPESESFEAGGVARAIAL